MKLARWFVNSRGVVLALMLASAAINIALSLECARLRETLRDVQSHRSVPKAKLTSFTAKSIDGRPTGFTFPREKMVLLYAFSPTCVWSRRNHPYAVSLSKKLGMRADFAAVSLSNDRSLLEAYIAEHPCPFPTLIGVSSALKRDLNMGVTPQLLVLSPAGELVKVWSGAFVDKNREEIEAFLHVKI
jgi:hypothetical protein